MGFIAGLLNLIALILARWTCVNIRVNDSVFSPGRYRKRKSFICLKSEKIRVLQKTELVHVSNYFPNVVSC